MARLAGLAGEHDDLMLVAEGLAEGAAEEAGAAGDDDFHGVRVSVGPRAAGGARLTTRRPR